MNGFVAVERRNLILMLLVAAALWLGSLDYRHLVQPDEGRYAEIPRAVDVRRADNRKKSPPSTCPSRSDYKIVIFRSAWRRHARLTMAP